MDNSGTSTILIAYIISTSPSKEKEANFILSTNAEQMQSCERSLDFILDTVSASPILELLKVNGTLSVVGAPENPFQLPAFPLIFGKRTIKGSIIGGMKDTQEMMDLCGKYSITCEIELIKPDYINQALALPKTTISNVNGTA